ncbi:hypothetical protein ADK57_09625 [Streptomyces sp. MMG1533]|nr:hypothetical protein ADK57_09625 [Streptomyces sp. MMG1533]
MPIGRQWDARHITGETITACAGRRRIPAVNRSRGARRDPATALPPTAARGDRTGMFRAPPLIRPRT